MKTIWKYPLTIHPSRNKLVMPKGSKPLAVQWQEGVPVLWAEVQTDDDPDQVVIVSIYGTGHAMDESTETYLGTLQGGVFVWHVYWSKPAP